MQTVGSYEAKTRLPELLRAVELGDVVTITRRGVPVARLISVDHDGPEEPATIIARMKSARARRLPVSVDEILAARDEGRRG
jgi:prevent-host-death family protein